MDEMNEHQGAPRPRAALAQRRRTSHGRGAGFATDEVMDLLAIIRQLQPLHGDDWTDVARQHNTVDSHPSRTADSLRRKFASLCRLAPPGDGNDRHWSREVREAVRVRKVIDQRHALGGATGDEPLASDAVRAAFENVDEDGEGGSVNNPPEAANSVASDGADSTDAVGSTDQVTTSETVRLTAPASPPMVPSRVSRQRQRQVGRASVSSTSYASPSAATVPPRVAYTPTQASWSPQIAGPPSGAATMYPGAPVYHAPWLGPTQAPQSQDEVLQLLKVQIVTNQQEEQSRRAAEDRWRQEERERRSEERREREKDRQEERKFREEMMHRHEQMMEAMLLLIAKQDK